MRWTSATGALLIATVCAEPVRAQPTAREAAVGFAVYGFARADAQRVRAMVRAAARDGRVTDLSDAALERAVFDGAPPVDATADVEKAQARLQRAAEQIQAFALDAAKRNVLRARRMLAPHLGLRAAREHDRRRLYLAVAIAHAERDEDTVAALLRSFARRFWTIHPVETPWPPDVRDQLQVERQRTPMRSLRITSPLPARAFVDGLAVGPTPVVTRVPVGRHRIELTAPDTWGATTTVDVSDSPAEVRLIPNAPLITTLERTRQLDESVKTRILDVARRWGLTSVYAIGPAARGQLKLERLGREPQGPLVVANSPDATRIGLLQLWPTRAPPEDDGLSEIWPWITVGAGAALIGTGIAFNVQAQSTQDDFQAQRHFLTQAEAFELRDQRDADAVASSVFIGVGASVVAGGLTWAILEWLDDE